MTVKNPIAASIGCLALSGCVGASTFGPDGGNPRRDLSPAAVAALPQGISPDFLLQNGDGCYLVVLETSDPPRGVLLRDAFGVPVCD